jgi:hypothetical protein
MNKLREIHLYLGCLFAPILIFFAITGAWQLFALHRGRKDGSYIPPRVVALLSDVHQFQHIPPSNYEASTPLRYFVLAAAFGLVATTILGIVMALRYGRNRAWAVLCLAGGIIIPVGLLLLFR